MDRQHCVKMAFLFLLAPVHVVCAQIPFTLNGPDVDPSDFRITTYATGLNFPIGMTELADGSVLVAVSQGANFFTSSSGSLIRLFSSTNNGIADTQNTLVANVPGGGLTSVRRAGDLIITTGHGPDPPISIYRVGETSTDPFTPVGSITFTYPPGADNCPSPTCWQHRHSALSVRQTPGIADSYDILFHIGSKTNADITSATVDLSSDIGLTGTLNGDALHMFRLTDHATSVSGSNLTQLASGLRNAAGHAFQPDTGDLFFQDNGIDGLLNRGEPLSADELNVIPAAEIGGTIDFFGFPDNYTEYRTDVLIGEAGTLPRFAFQPIPAPIGAEAEGANDITFSPEAFPAPVNQGVFVGMHGQFLQGGVSNQENPLVFANLSDDSYFHFIQNTEPAVGHLNGLLSTADSLYVADMSPTGNLGGNVENTGIVYQITSAVRHWIHPHGAADWSAPNHWTGHGAPASFWKARLTNTESVDKRAIVNNDSTVREVTVNGDNHWMSLHIESAVKLRAPGGVVLGSLSELSGGGIVDGDVTNHGRLSPGATWAGSMPPPAAGDHSTPEPSTLVSMLSAVLFVLSLRTTLTSHSQTG